MSEDFQKKELDGKEIEPVGNRTTEATQDKDLENEATEQITTGMETKSVGVGTALYRAPEVKESGKYDNKVDLFSLGRASTV